MEDLPSYISAPEAIAAWRDELDREGRRVVFTNGCFDLLHAGHVRYLKEARALGDALVVALNGDASVRALKGEGRPVNGVEDRAEILCALRSVDRVVVFDEPRVTRLIEQIRPHIYTKGGDYTVESLNAEERSALEQVGAQIAILSLVEGRSTSATLRKLASAESAGKGRLKLGVLGSGRGSNFDAIARAIAAGELDAEVVLVISDKRDAGILKLAEAHGVPGLHVEHPAKRARAGEAAEKEIVDRLRAAGVDLVVLAGYMRIVGRVLLDAFPNRVINIHPSLLPQFPGKEAWVQAYEAGVSETGCTVHIVNEQIDAGPVLAQERVPRLPEDTVEDLQRRIQEAEHRLLPATIARWR